MVGVLRKVALFRVGRSQFAYVVWLFLCFNVYILREIATESERRDGEVPGVRRIERSSLHVATKKILLWNPWYGDFGFTFDDETAFA